VIDRIKSYREPATVVALVVVLLGIAITSGRIASGLQDLPLAQVLRGVSGLYGLVDALVLTVLALTCVLVRPQTRHAVQVTLAAAALIWLGAVVGLVFLFVSLFAAGEGSVARVLESIGGLTDIALRVLMGYALVLSRRVALESASPATPVLEPAQPVPAAAPDDPARRPTWQSDQATGVVWRSAADAASGAAAGTYGAAGRGWDVDPQTPEAPPLRETTGPDTPGGPRIVLPDETTPEPRSGPPIWDPAADVTRQDRQSPPG
jgi:hypothetical protein